MAEIRILRPGDEAALEAFLWPWVESSMFLLGNLRVAGLLDTGQPYEGTYAAAFEGGEVVGAVAHYWNNNLVFQAPVHLDALWRAAVGTSGRPIHGLLGPEAQVAGARESIGLDEAQVQMDETETLYRLALADLVVPEGLRLGRLRGRPVERRDLDVITAWQVGFSVETLGEDETPQLWEECRAGVERSLGQGRTWVVEDGGEPVACSSFNTAIREAVQIGGVFTPPELRRRGYGRAAVAASLLDARAAGVVMAILFTGVENVAAQRAYEALGFQPVGTYRLILLRAVDSHPAGRRTPTIRPATLADVETLAVLCGQLGYASSPEQVRRRLEQIVQDPDNAVLVAEGENGQVVGWVQVYRRELLIDDRHAELGGLVVAEGQRGQRVGQLLMEEVERWARARGCKAVYVRSNVIRERAHRFYERIGYKVIKTQRAFWKGLDLTDTSSDPPGSGKPEGSGG
jgi:ribosomal protein S18 acetylase RimI-like enzyme